MKIDLRIWLLFLSHMLLFWLLGTMNDVLAPYGLYLYAPGLFVVFAAFYVPLRPGFLSTALTGAMVDAASPTTFGANILLLLFVYTALNYSARRLELGQRIHLKLGGQIANICLFLGMTIWAHHPETSWGAYLLVSAPSLILSQALVWLLTIWYCDFQKSLLLLCRCKMMIPA